MNVSPESRIIPTVSDPEPRIDVRHGAILLCISALFMVLFLVWVVA